MYKKLSIGIVLFLLATPLFGQIFGNRVVNVLSLPATCGVGGPLYQLITPPVALYECTATNTLTKVGPATSPSTVPSGGTGVTSFTAYAPIFGGTTSTGALQSGTVGTSGQILTSNGPGALPTFQAAAAAGVTGTGTLNVVPRITNATGPVIGDSAISDDGTTVSTGARTVLIGAVASATPAARTLTVAESSRGGTDSNVAGASGTIRPGNGTGTGGSGSILFQTAPVAASSTTANTMATAFMINNAQQSIFGTASILGTRALPLVTFGGTTTTGFYHRSSPTTLLDLSVGGTDIVEFNSGFGFIIPSGMAVGWMNQTTVGAGPDTGLSRCAALVVCAGTGSVNTTTAFVRTGGTCVVASDQTNASTTPQTAACYQTTSGTVAIALAAGRTYTGKCELFLSDSTAVDGAAIDFDAGTATATTFRAQITAFDTALNLSSQTTALATDAAASTFTGAGAFEIHFGFKVNAAGTFQPRFMQVAHTAGTLTLAALSHCTLVDATP